MADFDSCEEYESAESETELTDKDITDKFPTLEIKQEHKTAGSPSKTKETTMESESQEEGNPPNKDKPSQEGNPNELSFTSAGVQGPVPEQEQEPVPKQEQGRVQQEQEQATSTTNKAAETNSSTQSGGWGWGGWGNTISGILSSSVSAVSESAHSLGKGIGSIVSNVEGALGVPQPEEMVREPEPLAEEQDEKTEQDERKDGDIQEKQVDSDSSPTIAEPQDNMAPTEATTEEQQASVGGFLSGITAAVQTTGMGLMSGGLDALEAIGRKTVNIISEGDPGLRNKRAMLSGQASTLSKLLREAKEEAENNLELANEDGSNSENITINYSILFDHYDGLVHLEALELLSKECSNKVRTSLSALSGEESETQSKKLEGIEKYFQEDTNEEPSSEGSIADILNILGELGKKAKAEKLVKACKTAREKISQLGNESLEQSTVIDAPPTSGADNETETASSLVSVKEYHDSGLHILAELSSVTIELLKKSAELILIQSVVDITEVELGQMFQRVTSLICVEFEAITTLLTDKISQETSEEADSLITSLYLESSNSCSYIQDAFVLLWPVLQLKVLENTESPSPPLKDDANQQDTSSIEATNDGDNS